MCPRLQKVSPTGIRLDNAQSCLKGVNVRLLSMPPYKSLFLGAVQNVFNLLGLAMNIQFSFVNVLLVALTLGSCSSSDSTRDTPTRVPAHSGQVYSSMQSDTNMISIGDSIALSVWDAPQFNANANVGPSGEITIPLIGETKVVGYNKEEVVRILRRKLSEYIKGDASFSLEIIHPKPRITVVGMVGKLGSIPVDGEVSLLDALLKAGGWLETADLRYIRITRQSTGYTEKNSIEFDLTTFLETGDMRGMPIVRPGDIVVVPKKENYISEFGGFVSSIFVLFGFLSLFK